MAYRLPNFSLLMQGWLWGHTPFGDAPDVFDIPGQIYIQSRQGGLPTDPDNVLPEVPTIMIRMPLAVNPMAHDIGIWDVDGGITNLYLVYFKEVMHRGFANAYVVHYVQQCDASGTPRRQYVP